jgi:hypothetical protein
LHWQLQKGHLVGLVWRQKVVSREIRPESGIVIFELVASFLCLEKLCLFPLQLRLLLDR